MCAAICTESVTALNFACVWHLSRRAHPFCTSDGLCPTCTFKYAPPMHCPVVVWLNSCRKLCCASSVGGVNAGRVCQHVIVICMTHTFTNGDDLCLFKQHMSVTRAVWCDNLKPAVTRKFTVCVHTTLNINAHPVAFQQAQLPVRSFCHLSHARWTTIPRGSTLNTNLATLATNTPRDNSADPTR